MILIAGEGDQKLRRDVVLQHRDPVNERTGDGVRRVLRNIAAPEPPGGRSTGRIEMPDGDSFERTVRLTEIDEAPVGEPRHGQRGDRSERAFVVERTAENLAGFGEEMACVLR